MWKMAGVGIQDILASFLESGRKWRRVVHLWSTLHERYRSFPPYWPVCSIIRATYTRSLMFLTSNTVFLPHTEVWRALPCVFCELKVSSSWHRHHLKMKTCRLVIHQRKYMELVFMTCINLSSDSFDVLCVTGVLSQNGLGCELHFYWDLCLQRINSGH